MPAPIKYAKDENGNPTGPSETQQVKALLRIEDTPAPGPGKKPIQHPIYKQIRDAVTASARQRAVYSVKSPGYVEMLENLVFGKQVPHLNQWIPHWPDRETVDTDGENFYAHLSWLVQDVIKNLKAGLKRDRKKEGGEDLSLPQATSHPELQPSHIHSSPPARQTAFPISLIVFRRGDGDEAPPTLAEWSLQAVGVLITVLSVASPTFSSLHAATRRYTDPLNLAPHRYYGLKRPEVVNGEDGSKALRPTDVVALQMDGQVSGFVSQMDKFQREIIIGVSVSEVPPREAVPPTPRHRKATKTQTAPLPDSPPRSSAGPSKQPLRHDASPSKLSSPASAYDIANLDFNNLLFPVNVRDLIYLNRRLRAWKTAFDKYVMALKNDADTRGLYDSVCFADEVCFYYHSMTEEEHAEEKAIYAACGYSNVVASQTRYSFELPEEGSALYKAITSKLREVKRSSDGVAQIHVPVTALNRMDERLAAMDDEAREREKEERAMWAKKNEDRFEQIREEHYRLLFGDETAWSLSPQGEDASQADPFDQPSPPYTNIHDRPSAAPSPPRVRSSSPSRAPSAPPPVLPSAPPSAASTRNSSPISEFTDIEELESRLPPKLRGADASTKEVEDAAHHKSDTAHRKPATGSGKNIRKRDAPQSPTRPVIRGAKSRRAKRRR